ncbi:MAG: hypothetical protein MJZ36_10220 [Bacteroidaceae bacterium]|nr:hypothetical protein [Bacteroidaceae bacterium]
MTEDKGLGINFNAPVTVGTFVKVESGATYIKNNFPGVTHFEEAKEDDKESQPLSSQSLKDKIESVKHLIKNNRHWFSICKVLMKARKVGIGDFEAAANMILEAYGNNPLPKPIDVKDISKINVGGMKGNPEEWYDDVTNEVHNFGSYQTLAFAFERVL